MFNFIWKCIKFILKKVVSKRKLTEFDWKLNVADVVDYAEVDKIQLDLK